MVCVAWSCAPEVSSPLRAGGESPLATALGLSELVNEFHTSFPRLDDAASWCRSRMECSMAGASSGELSREIDLLVSLRDA